MFEFLNTWQFSIFGFLIASIAFHNAYHLAVKNTKNDGASTVLLQLLAAASSALFIPFFELKVPESRYIWLIGVACVFYAIYDRLQTPIRKNLPPSTFSIIDQLNKVFLIVIGFTIFQEEFVLAKVIGAALIILANVLIFYKKGAFKLGKYSVLGVVATLVLAVALSIDIGIVEQFNMPMYIAITLSIPALMVGLIERIKPVAVISEFNSSTRKYYILTGVSWFLSIFFSLRSFTLGEVTTVVPLQATVVLLNVIFGYFAFGEKEGLVNKILASVIILIGVLFTLL